MWDWKFEIIKYRPMELSKVNTNSQLVQARCSDSLKFPDTMFPYDPSMLKELKSLRAHISHIPNEREQATDCSNNEQ